MSTQRTVDPYTPTPPLRLEGRRGRPDHLFPVPLVDQGGPTPSPGVTTRVPTPSPPREIFVLGHPRLT